MHKTTIVWKGIGLLLIFFIFFLAATEDRSFKRWKTTNHDLFLSFKWVRDYAKINLPVSSRFLIDYSELKKINLPFKKRIIGKMRQKIYLILYPEIRSSLYRVRTSGPFFRVERLNRRKKYRLVSALSMKKLAALKLDDYESQKKLMLENGISYYICCFRNWRNKKRTLVFLGFKLIYNNARFMLFSLKN